MFRRIVNESSWTVVVVYMSCDTWDEKVTIWDEKVTIWDEMGRKWDEMGRKWDVNGTRWDVNGTRWDEMGRKKKRRHFTVSCIIYMNVYFIYSFSLV